MAAIPDALIDIALESTSGSDFESFAHGLLAEFSGDTYLPMGGTHDGGADGLYQEFISEVANRPGSFAQMSIETTVVKLCGVTRLVVVLSCLAG